MERVEQTLFGYGFQYVYGTWITDEMRGFGDLG